MAGLNLVPYHKNCESCGSSTVSAVSATGEPIPVDYNPDPDRGDVLLSMVRGQLVAAVLKGGRLKGAQAGGAKLRTEHAVTCPYSDRFRARR